MISTPALDGWSDLAPASERFFARYDARLEAAAWRRLGNPQHELDLVREVSLEGFAAAARGRGRPGGLVVGHHADLMEALLPGWERAHPQQFLDGLWQGPHARRDILVLSGDLAHLLLLRGDLMARVADQVERRLVMPIRLPTRDPAVLWAEGWSGVRGGQFVHRRMRDVREGAWLTLLVDGADYAALKFDLRIGNSHAGHVDLELRSEHGSQLIGLEQPVTSAVFEMYARPGRSTLQFAVRSRQPGHALFVDVGVMGIGRTGSEAKGDDCGLQSLRDDGNVMFASDAHVRDRLHNFGFVGSRAEVFVGGLRLGFGLPPALTRTADLAATAALSARQLSDKGVAAAAVAALYRLARIGGVDE